MNEDKANMILDNIEQLTVGIAKKRAIDAELEPLLKTICEGDGTIETAQAIRKLVWSLL